MKDKAILLSELCELIKEYPLDSCVPGFCCMHSDMEEPRHNTLFTVVKVHDWKEVTQSLHD